MLIRHRITIFKTYNVWTISARGCTALRIRMHILYETGEPLIYYVKNSEVYDFIVIHYHTALQYTKFIFYSRE